MKRERNENRTLPKPIEGYTLEQVARACMQGLPKKKWRFMQKKKSDKL